MDQAVSPLLNDSSQFTDATSLLTQNILCSGGHDDDLGSGWCHTDLNAGVAIFGKLASQELVQFSLEDASGDELKREISIIVVIGERLEAGFDEDCTNFSFKCCRAAKNVKILNVISRNG